MATPGSSLVWGRPPGCSPGVVVGEPVVLLCGCDTQGTALIVAAPLFSLRLGHPQCQGRKSLFPVFVSGVYKTHAQTGLISSPVLDAAARPTAPHFSDEGHEGHTALQEALSPCADTFCCYTQHMRQQITYHPNYPEK